MRVKFVIPVLASILILGTLGITPNAFAVTEDTKITASNADAFDIFGNSVSISGDTAIIGSPNDDDVGTNTGAAHVFVRSGSTWTEQAKLTASDAATTIAFGLSVFISGDTALVGSFGDGDAGPLSGAVYVFERSGTTWTEQAKLTAPDAAAFDFFGFSVFMSGDTAIVGALGNDDAGFNSGSAYVFVRSGTTWTQQAKLTASDTALGDNFGDSVSISGDIAIISAPGDDDACPSDPLCISGAAYVFTRSGTTWTEQVKLTASDAAFQDFFGRSVSMSGDTVIVSAILDDDACPSDPNCNSGSAYVFGRDVGGTDNWGQIAKLTASDAAAGDGFSRSVSISGDTVIVGADQDDDGGERSGSAYVFGRDVGGTDNWGQIAKLTASDAAALDFFGVSVSISGDTAIVGANGNSDAGTQSGSAYVFNSPFADPTVPGLVDQIITLGLPDSVTQSLSGPLEQAQTLLDDGVPQNDAAVCGKLTAFLNEVDAKEGNGQLTSEQADDLRATGQAVIEDLGC